MIIVPGSVNADLLFKVAKLPRPGETVLCPSYVMAPGGKGAPGHGASRGHSHGSR